jgi:hypothetical protein
VSVWYYRADNETETSRFANVVGLIGIGHTGTKQVADPAEKELVCHRTSLRYYRERQGGRDARPYRVIKRQSRPVILQVSVWDMLGACSLLLL